MENNDMAQKIKECVKPHSLMHSLAGVGIGVMLAGIFGGLEGTAGIILGILLVVAGIAGDYVVNNPDKNSNAQ